MSQFTVPNNSTPYNFKEIFNKFIESLCNSDLKNMLLNSKLNDVYNNVLFGWTWTNFDYSESRVSINQDESTHIIINANEHLNQTINVVPNTTYTVALVYKNIIGNVNISVLPNAIEDIINLENNTEGLIEKALTTDEEILIIRFKTEETLSSDILTISIDADSNSSFDLYNIVCTNSSIEFINLESKSKLESRIRFNTSNEIEYTYDGINYYKLLLDDTGTSKEYIQDTVGGMVTSNTESGISVTYDDTNGKLNFDVNDFTLSFNGDVTGNGVISNLSNTNISLQVADNSHLHTSQNISDWNEAVQDTVGGMVTSNTESGISVTYDDTNGKLNFDVNDFMVTLTGDVGGQATITNLGNTIITTTVHNYAHTHDGVYPSFDYVETNYVSINGDVMTGSLGINENLTVSKNTTLKDVIITGDLTVSGSTTTVNTEVVNIADNIINLNSNYTGNNPTENSGFAINRGTLFSPYLVWDETNDYFTLSNDGTNKYKIATYNSEIAEYIQDTVGGMVTSNTESGISVTYDDTNGKLNFDVNDFSITLSGDVSGSGTITNLGNVTIVASVANDSHTHTSATISGLDGSYLSLSGGTMNGIIASLRESSNNFGVTSGTINLNLAANNQFIVEPNGNITVNAINTPVGAITLLLIIKGNGTSFITTWNINAKWPNGTPPSIDTTANKYNLIILNTYNQGTTWFGTHQLLY